MNLTDKIKKHILANQDKVQSIFDLAKKFKKNPDVILKILGEMEKQYKIKIMYV